MLSSSFLISNRFLKMYFSSKDCFTVGLKQESALKDALDRLAADIDQKLDRLELDPLKEYFGEWRNVYI